MTGNPTKGVFGKQGEWCVGKSLPIQAPKVPREQLVRSHQERPTVDGSVRITHHHHPFILPLLLRPTMEGSSRAPPSSFDCGGGKGTQVGLCGSFYSGGGRLFRRQCILICGWADWSGPCMLGRWAKGISIN